MSTAIVASIGIIFLVLVGYLMYLVTKQKRSLSRFSNIIDLEAEQKKIRASIEQEEKEAKKILDSLNSQQSQINSEISNAQDTLTTLKDEITVVQDTAEIQSFGLYEPKYDFGTSAEYKEKLDEIRSEQKSMIKEKTAIICPIEWAVDNNKAKGRTMINRKIKLMARAFNGECDSIILKVRYNNIQSIEKRIESAYKAINKLGESNKCSIQMKYLPLKLDELRLVHEYAEKRQNEMEEERRIREQIRDEERALREIEKAKQDAEKEEQRYQKALDKAWQDNLLLLGSLTIYLGILQRVDEQPSYQFLFV